jgi:hypothetical protein
MPRRGLAWLSCVITLLALKIRIDETCVQIFKLSSSLVLPYFVPFEQEVVVVYETGVLKIRLKCILPIKIQCGFRYH